jgi:hypothetical protein
MKETIAVLADYASLSIDQKLNILGIFTRIVSRAEPVTHAQMQLVVGYEFEPAEAGRKDMKVVLIDADGRMILSMAGEVNIVPSLPGEPCAINQIIQLNNITFPKFGDYEFQVLINERIESTIPFRVVRLPIPGDQSPV